MCDISLSINGDKNIIVPVVCDDMFEYIGNKGEQPISLNDFVSRNLIMDIDKNKNAYKAILSNYYYGISLLEDSKNKNYSNTIYEMIKNKMERIKLKECVRIFLEDGNFPLIITTFGFPIIEKTLGYNEDLSEWFNPNDRNDLPMNTGNGNHVVYHIFGGKNSVNWVYNEQTLLKFMHALHSVDYGAKNLSNYLCDNNPQVSKLLVLGSTLPDWLFRFLIYPMFQGEGEKLKGGYWLSLDNIEKGLDLFLKRNEYERKTNLRKKQYEDGNLDKILEDAVRLQENNGGNVCIKREPIRIFISYKRENNDLEMKKKLERVVALLKNKEVFGWM